MTCPLAEQIERVLEKFVTVTVTRLESALDLVALRGQVAMLNEAIANGGDSQLLNDLLAKRTALIVERLGEPLSLSVAEGSSITSRRSDGHSMERSDPNSSKTKRGRPRKVPSAPETVAAESDSLESSPAGPPLFAKE